MKKIILSLVAFMISAAAHSETIYQKPDANIDRFIKGPDSSSPVFNRQRTALIKVYGEDYPSIKYVSRERQKLAGLQFNPKNYSIIANAYDNRLVYMDLKTKKEKPIKLPQDAIVRETLWSPDGKNLAVTIETDQCHEVWIVKIPSLQKSKVPNICLNAVFGASLTWINAEQLHMRVRTPQQAKALVTEKEAPTGPIVLESGGRVSQNRTFPNLLKTQQDAVTFEKAVLSQNIIYHVKTSRVQKIGPIGIYTSFSYSPDRQFILVRTIEKPFSYTVPVSLFAGKTQVWTASGQYVTTIAEGGPYENIPIEGEREGPRNITWVNSEPSTLFYVVALDKGDWEVKADFRDELFIQHFKGRAASQPESIYKMKFRFDGFDAMDGPQSFWIEEYERDRKWKTTYLLHKVGAEWKTKTLFSLSEDDDYGSPGSPVYKRNSDDRFVIAVDRSKKEPSIYMNGKGSTPQGDFPFLRRMSLETLKTEELYRSKPGSYEAFNLFFGQDEYHKFLISYQSPTEPRRFEIVDISSGSPQKELLYADEDPFQKAVQIRKELVTYKRRDGVQLSATLYYPTDFVEGQKYPAIIQAYPLEYADVSTAGQVRGSEYYYSRPQGSSILFNLMRGYVVLTEAQMPIIGPPETKNDTFIPQLVSGAEAAVDFLKQKGIVDEKRIGVIGHSYGAFMVAHLLTHSNLFATGVARSGAYNRTLTPNGFQGERRPFWKAKETYIRLSPFIDADKMKKPLLLVHGMADTNPGTFTLQSERYFEALKAQGAVARLVLLPDEGHGYEAFESNRHVLYETFKWFDQYLKTEKK